MSTEATLQNLIHERDANQKALAHWRREYDTLVGETQRLRRTVSDQSGELRIASAIAEERYRDIEGFLAKMTGWMAAQGFVTPLEGYRTLTDVMNDLRRKRSVKGANLTITLPDPNASCMCEDGGDVSSECPQHTPHGRTLDS